MRAREFGRQFADLRHVDIEQSRDDRHHDHRGERSGMDRWIRGRISIIAATAATTASAGSALPHCTCATTSMAANNVRSPAGAVAPNAAGTCWRKMIAAMPR